MCCVRVGVDVNANADATPEISRMYDTSYTYFVCMKGEGMKKLTCRLPKREKGKKNYQGVSNICFTGFDQ